MDQAQRIQKILQLLEKNRVLSTEEIINEMGMSSATVRSDIRKIHEMGLANKTHGKIEVIDKLPQELHAKVGFRKIWNIQSKRYIAKKIVDQLPQTNLIYLDESITALCVAQELKKRLRPMSIVTNSFLIIQELINCPEFSIICAGGHLVENAQGFGGQSTLQAILECNVPLAVMGAFGLNSQGTLEIVPAIHEMKKTIAEKVPTVIVVADNFKFTHSGGYLCIPWKNINIFGTNELPADLSIDDLEGFTGQII